MDQTETFYPSFKKLYHMNKITNTHQGTNLTIEIEQLGAVVRLVWVIWELAKEILIRIFLWARLTSMDQCQYLEETREAISTYMERQAIHTITISIFLKTVRTYKINLTEAIQVKLSAFIKSTTAFQIQVLLYQSKIQTYWI